MSPFHKPGPPEPTHLHSFSLQQAAVGGDLRLQAGLDVQEDLVLLTLPPQVTADLRQLSLHVADQALHLSQLGAVAALGLHPGGFQGIPLQWERGSTPNVRESHPETHSPAYLGTTCDHTP